jgi:hypothetical protein
MSILSITDFKGKYKLSEFTSNTDRISEAIDIVEDKILYDLLGSKLRDEFITGIGIPPIAEKWENLLDGIKYEYNSIEIVMKGIKEMLIPFTYAYIGEKNYFDSPQGTIQSNADAGKTVGQQKRLTLSNAAYNDGVNQYKSVQLYLSDNTDIYENWVTQAKTGKW